MKKTAILLNPTAGGGRAAAIWDRLRKEPRVSDLPLLVGDTAQEMLERLDAALEDGVERLAVIGGDGTLNLAVDRLLHRGQGEAVILGLVAAGTGSDLARHLGLPRAPEAAMQAALNAPAQPQDALRLDAADGSRRYAANLLSGGVSGIAGEMVNSEPSTSSRPYLSSTVKALLRYRPTRVRLFVDDEVEAWFDGDLLLLAVANGRYFGKGMKIAPGARCDDGLAEIVVVKPIPWCVLAFQLPYLFWGDVLTLRAVHHRQGSRVRLEVPPEFPAFDLDGEVGPAGSAEVRILPGALRVAVP